MSLQERSRPPQRERTNQAYRNIQPGKAKSDVSPSLKSPITRVHDMQEIDLRWVFLQCHTPLGDVCTNKKRRAGWICSSSIQVIHSQTCRKRWKRMKNAPTRMDFVCGGGVIGIPSPRLRMRVHPLVPVQLLRQERSFRDRPRPRPFPRPPRRSSL